MDYAHMATNAHVLEEGNRTLLSREQIDALAQLEHEFVEGMHRSMHPSASDIIENVLHAFMCDALGDCVCRFQQNREVT